MLACKEDAISDCASHAGQYIYVLFPLGSDAIQHHRRPTRRGEAQQRKTSFIGGRPTSYRLTSTPKPAWFRIRGATPKGPMLRNHSVRFDGRVECVARDRAQETHLLCPVTRTAVESGQFRTAVATAMGHGEIARAGAPACYQIAASFPPFPMYSASQVHERRPYH